LKASDLDARETDQLVALAAQVVDRALSAGATVAEAVAGHERHLSAKVRLGKPEVVEEAGSRSLGLRVMRDVGLCLSQQASRPHSCRTVDGSGIPGKYRLARDPDAEGESSKAAAADD
jgi:hypothetical protein